MCAERLRCRTHSPNHGSIPLATTKTVYECGKPLRQTLLRKLRSQSAEERVEVAQESFVLATLLGVAEKGGKRFMVAIQFGLNRCNNGTHRRRRLSVLVERRRDKTTHRSSEECTLQNVEHELLRFRSHARILWIHIRNDSTAISMG